MLRERLAATLPPLVAPPRSPALMTTPRRPLNQSNSLPPSSMGGSSIGGGTMRHDIPHRWKPFFVLTQLKCAVCLDGLTRVRHASKCVGQLTIAYFSCIYHNASFQISDSVVIGHDALLLSSVQYF